MSNRKQLFFPFSNVVFYIEVVRLRISLSTEVVDLMLVSSIRFRMLVLWNGRCLIFQTTYLGIFMGMVNGGLMLNIPFDPLSIPR